MRLVPTRARTVKPWLGSRRSRRYALVQDVEPLLPLSGRRCGSDHGNGLRRLPRAAAPVQPKSIPRTDTSADGQAGFARVVVNGFS
jgi:hypothetical protein